MKSLTFGGPGVRCHTLSRRQLLGKGYVLRTLVGVDELCLWAVAAWWIVATFVNIDGSPITKSLYHSVHSAWTIRLILVVIVAVHGYGIFAGRIWWRRQGMYMATSWWFIVTLLQVTSSPLNTATGSYGLLIVPLAFWRCWALQQPPPPLPTPASPDADLSVVR